ncbi:MAG: transposase [Candidatus Omnitrophica bacterium]|nr:transposase [Candidatus Omnitrophota bacterium]MBI3021007.1 transposase [Candidatus Omnitrophota bacterium]
MGNRTSLTDPVGLHSYTYDALSRLTGAIHPAPSGLVPEAFTFDPVSNRLTSHLSATHVHDAANRLLEDDAFTYPMTPTATAIPVPQYYFLQATTAHWLAALDMAVNRQFPQGIEGQALHLMSDNGCQPTSVRFLATCGQLGITQAFTSYNNPKGNADTERSIRTFKEECVWVRDWTSPFELADRVATWFESFNVSYLHSSLGYRTPEAFEQQWISSHQTLLASA